MNHVTTIKTNHIKVKFNQIFKIMKRNFLIPVAGFFALAIAFSASGNSSQDETSNLFVGADNIAYADTGQDCGYRAAHYYVTDNNAYYDQEYCH